MCRRKELTIRLRVMTAINSFGVTTIFEEQQGRVSCFMPSAPSPNRLIPFHCESPKKRQARKDRKQGKCLTKLRER